MLLAIIALVIVALIAMRYYQRRDYRRRDDESETFSLPAMTFTQTRDDKTYVFADPISPNASVFDRALHEVTDATIPVRVLPRTGTPEPSPYTDSEVQAVVRAALHRASEKLPTLRYVMTDFATKSVDSKGNAQFDIVFFAYDTIKNFGSKIALVVLVTPKGTTYIKTFRSFNRPAADDANAPVGVDDLSPQHSTFVNDLGIDYVKLYG